MVKMKDKCYRIKIKLPQEDSQSSESLSGVLTPGCPKDSGGDKFCDGGKSGKRAVGNQASEFQNATGRRKDMEEDTAFAMSSRLQHSPIGRKNSMSDYFPTVDTNSRVTQTSKRLREESPIEEETGGLIKGHTSHLSGSG